MPIRHAQLDDLPEMLALYSAPVSGCSPEVAERDGTRRTFFILGRRLA
ncbi:MAG: hypothetical protein H0T80_04585 [Betaproteobacteria bacterium]|nr:hypothetical protein [Betaproteobacteria bacterium]